VRIGTGGVWGLELAVFEDWNWRCVRIGTWNVLSLYRPGASNILEKQWSICEKIMKEAAESAIGMQGPPQRNDWFDDECAAPQGTTN
jgi:hypothetical protein